MRYHRARFRPNAKVIRESPLWEELGALVLLVFIICSVGGLVAALSAANDCRRENACPTFCTMTVVDDLRMRKVVEDIEKKTLEMTRDKALHLPDERITNL